MKLRLACAPDVRLQRLQAFLGLLYQRDLALEAEVTHMPSAGQLQRLRDGDLDLGVLHDPGPAAGIVTEPLYHGEALTVVVPVGHRLAACETIGPTDLAGDMLLVLPREAEPSYYDRVVAVAGGDGPPLRSIREAPGPDVRDLLFAVASGQGVTVAPRSALGGVGPLGDAVEARPLAPPAFMPDTCLAWAAEGRAELAGLHAAARAAARELYRP